MKFVVLALILFVIIAVMVLARRNPRFHHEPESAEQLPAGDLTVRDEPLLGEAPQPDPRFERPPGEGR